ncbi:MAG: DUF551 domain-containing protein [Dysgonamonadaceae bacterium]|jgi:hypothetical protein|nr:DUF551 domain-containing protein [Dysgonamonadaceae bacterium]
MKTKKEAAQEYAQRTDKANAEFVAEDFIAGVEFAQRWISVKDELPEENGCCYFVKTPRPPKNCDVIVAEFCNRNDIFYSESNDNPVEATHWRPIELK